MITVRELMKHLAQEVTGLAGLAGTHRLITWAHTVDLPDPWRWIAAGNLVLTTGAGLPDAPDEQAAWLEQLVQHDASALVIARRACAPELSEALLATAERLMFPVLQASFDLSFVQLSQFVIERVLRAERDRFRASEQLFEAYAAALRRAPDMPGRLAALAAHLDMALRIEDAASGFPLYGNAVAEPHDGHPAVVERLPIPGRSRTHLVVARPDAHGPQAALLLQSLVGLLSVELERLMIERDARREEGAALLRSILDDEIELPALRPLLERRGLTGALVIAAVQPGTEGSWSTAELHHAPGLHALLPLLLDDGVLLALISDADDTLARLASPLGTGTAVGVSGPITDATGFRESVRQARFALARATAEQRPLVRYGDFDTGLVLAPKSLAEVRALIGRYLGPLIEYDRANAASLLQTLTTFLDNDGNMKSTAFDLQVHRQTLVYRLKLIEKVSGFKPTTVDGSARFWFSIQAARSAGLMPGTG